MKTPTDAQYFDNEMNRFVRVRGGMVQHFRGNEWRDVYTYTPSEFEHLLERKSIITIFEYEGHPVTNVKYTDAFIVAATIIGGIIVINMAVNLL